MYETVRPRHMYTCHAHSSRFPVTLPRHVFLSHFRSRVVPSFDFDRFHEPCTISHHTVNDTIILQWNWNARQKVTVYAHFVWRSTYTPEELKVATTSWRVRCSWTTWRILYRSHERLTRPHQCFHLISVLSFLWRLIFERKKFQIPISDSNNIVPSRHSNTIYRSSTADSG